MMENDRPDILIFPPVASVVAPIAAVALEWLLPLMILPQAFSTIWMPVLGLGAVALAGMLGWSGDRAFKRAGTNVNPREPALQVVRDGPYRFSRNPMYLGMVILQIGLALTFSLDWGILTAPVLWAVLHWGVVLREERYLKEKFGAPYEDLLRRTRRWL